MRNTDLPVIMGVVISGLVAITGMAEAANSATVTATATFQNVSVTVSDGSITYGTLAAGTSKSTIAADLNDTQTVTNNGNVAEQINIRGTDSSPWTLAGTAGSDQYVHAFCTSGCATPPTGFTNLTTSNTQLVANLAKDATQTFDLRITAPTVSTSNVQQQVNVTIQATAI